jgi:hypothetical protein
MQDCRVLRPEEWDDVSHGHISGPWKPGFGQCVVWRTGPGIPRNPRYPVRTYRWPWPGLATFHSFYFQILSQPLFDLVNKFTHIHGAQQDHFEPVPAQTFLHDAGSAGDDPDGEFTRAPRLASGWLTWYYAPQTSMGRSPSSSMMLGAFHRQV